VIAGEGEAVVRRSPDQVLEFVMDLERYRQADRKIGAIAWLRRSGDLAEARFRARMLGLPGPMVTQLLHLTPGRRIDVRNAPSWLDRVMDFEGVITCEPVDGGTRVYHREAFELRRPLSWLLGPVLQRWLRHDTAAEVVRMRALLEREPASS
jgi:hypothetical protein